MIGLYTRLAATGIKKNGKSYIPYILTASLMISIFYIIMFLSENPILKQMVGGTGMMMILSMGTVVMGIFSMIFLYYTNTFLIKRRKKEFGLYNILGLGKGQIAQVLVWETLFVYVISVVVGLGFGILFSKLAEMLAAKILRGDVSYSFYVDFKAIIVALILFAAIFVMIMFNSLRQLFFSRPIELLHSESSSEKPPRTNIPQTVIGVLLLGIAYAVALMIQDPVAALPTFWLAVILVIIATYLLFITGSVVLCRILQKNKNYYYKTNHFVSVSQMAFRMRKNGAGLASICILSTMVLVTLSSTVSLYVGIPDTVKNRYPHDIVMTIYDDDSGQANTIIDKTNEKIEKMGYTARNASVSHNLDVYHVIGEYVMGLDIYDENGNSVNFYGEIMPIDEADENIKALNIQLGERDVAVFEPKVQRVANKKTMKFGELTFNVIPIETAPDSDAKRIYRTEEDYIRIFVKDTNVLREMYRQELNALRGHGSDYETIFINTDYSFDISDNISEVSTVYNSLKSTDFNVNVAWEMDTKATLLEEYYGWYSGLLFLGILLGGVFALAAALIMYYKQISEGFEDAARFDILRKVGMTRREIKSAINSQVLKVFFLPLVTAGIHMAFAFPMIAKMLNLFGMYNQGLFALVTIICYVMFALLYVLFYKITSRSYLGIVGGKKTAE